MRPARSKWLEIVTFGRGGVEQQKKPKTYGHGVQQNKTQSSLET